MRINWFKIPYSLVYNLPLIFFALVLFHVNDLSAQNELTVRCDENEITCTMQDFPRDIYSTNMSQGGILTCRGIELHNPLWYKFTAVPGDITITGTTTQCEPTPGAVSMSVWTLCSGGFNNPECLISSPCSGTVQGFLWNPQFLEIPDGLLEVGQIYFLAVGDCEGKDCDYVIEIDAEPFEIPGLLSGEVSLTTQECTSNLPPFKYCGGADLRFTVDHPSYDAMGGEYFWSINELDGNADASSVVWSANVNSGQGNPIRNGRFVFRQLGSNWIDMSFSEVGLYEICIDEVQTNCGHYVGPLCQEIEIIEPEKEEFGVYDVCYSQLYFDAWEGPGLDTMSGLEWISGNIFLSDVLTASQDDDDNFVVSKFSSPDGCNCSYEQEVSINLLGFGEEEEVELFLTECQLPYQWFDLTIFEIGEFFEESLVLSQASNHVDYKNRRCDSFVVVTVSEYELMPNVFQSDCTDMGKEFSFELLGTDLQGAEYYWVDAETGVAVTPTMEDPAAILPTGMYTIWVYGFIPDLNHNEGSVGTSPLSFIQCEFGPFEIFNPIPLDPLVSPYDTFRCTNQLDNIFFQLDTIQDSVSYSWIIPESIMDVTTISEGNDSVFISSIENLGQFDTVKVVAFVECGMSDTVNVPLVILEDAVAPDFEPIEACVGEEITISYSYTSGTDYFWDFGTAIVTGNTNNGNPFTVRYDQAGTYEYFLTISDNEECIVDGGPYIIEVYDTPPVPVIVCIEQNDPGTLVFEWEEVPGFEYSISASSSTGQFGTLNGTQYTFTDLPPLTTASVAVTASGPGPDGCNMSSNQISCATVGCDIPSLSINNFRDVNYCQNDPDAQPIQFDIVPPAGVTGSFDGPGVSSDGFLDPASPELSDAGSYIINYTYVQTSTGCTESISITVSIFDEVNFDIAGIRDFCPGESIDLSITGLSVPDADVLMQWQPYGVNDPSLTLPYPGFETPGDYTFSVLVTDTTSGCFKELAFAYSILDSINIETLEYACNDNGTPEDFDDDYYDVKILADGLSGTAIGEYVVFADNTQIGTFEYGEESIFELAANGNSVLLELMDVQSALCATSAVTDTLSPCEPQCELQSSAILNCNDNSTSNPSDDFYNVSVIAFVMNPGPSNMFDTYVDGEYIGTYDYTGGGSFEYPAVGSVDLLVQDVDNPDCNVSSLIFLNPCSVTRFECPDEAVAGFGVVYPVGGIVESRVNENVVAQKLNLDNNDEFTKMSVMGVQDDNKNICFQDSFDFEITLYDDSNGFPGTAQANYEFRSYAEPVGTYMDGNQERQIVKYTFDFEEVYNNNISWVSVANSDPGCSFNWVYGDEAPVTGGAVFDGTSWTGINSLNYCLFYEQVNNDNVPIHNLKIYPNPTSDLLFIENISEVKRITITDVLGQNIGNIHAPDQKYTFDLSDFDTGVYLLIFEFEDGLRWTYKIVRQ